MGGLFQLFWGRGRDLQELGHRTLVDLLWSASELSRRLWVCHLADVLNKRILSLKVCWKSLVLHLGPSWF